MELEAGRFQFPSIRFPLVACWRSGGSRTQGDGVGQD